jgi:hypothetical protein
MTKHIELKRFNQGTAMAANTLALTPLVLSPPLLRSLEGISAVNARFEDAGLCASVDATKKPM